MANEGFDQMVLKTKYRLMIKIHHLNCATLCPHGGRLVNRPSARLVCHCLLLETPQGLVLVDAGLSREHLSHPKKLGWSRHLLRVKADPSSSAIEQIKKLGFRPVDVRHIIATHLDLDHAGGIIDFPQATLHVHENEFEAMKSQHSLVQRERYKFARGLKPKKWELYNHKAGETWNGLEAIRELKGLKDLLLLPLSGHTPGSSAVVIPTSKGHLIHCGDAYYDYHQIHEENPTCSPGLNLFQHIIHMDRKRAQANLLKLRKLKKDHYDRIDTFCSHDPEEFEKLSGTKIL